MTAILLLLIVCALPTVLWWLFRPPRWRRAYQSGPKLVFAPSIRYQMAGFFVVSLLLPAMFYFVYSGFRDIGAYIVLVGFIAAGISLFGNEIHLYPSHFEKRFFWRKDKLPWSLIDRLLPLVNGKFLLEGNNQRIVFARHYIDFDRLLQEIDDRATAAHAQSDADTDPEPGKPDWVH